VPVALKKCDGFCSVEVCPSPKAQLYVYLPDSNTDEVNNTGDPAQGLSGNVKSTVGFAFTVNVVVELQVKLSVHLIVVAPIPIEVTSPRLIVATPVLADSHVKVAVGELEACSCTVFPMPQMLVAPLMVGFAFTVIVTAWELMSKELLSLSVTFLRV
jgi:hypothetical protein